MSTIQKYIDDHTELHAWCHKPGCGHHQQLDLAKLKERLGPDHGAMHDDLVPKMRCSKCGSKRLGLTVIPSYKSEGVNPFMTNSNTGRRFEPK